MESPLPNGTPTPTPSVTGRALRTQQAAEVPVFVLTSDPRSERARLVSDIFSDEMFTTPLVYVSPPDDRTLTARELEAYRLQMVLEQARAMDAKYALFVKDSSVSVAAPSTVRDVVRAAMTEEKDVAYLAYWEEQCSQFGARTTIADTTISLYDAVNPQGFQAVLLSARAQQKLLENEDFRAGRLASAMRGLQRESGMSAVVPYPPVISHDVTRSRDARKAQVCVASARGSEPAATPVVHDSPVIAVSDAPIMLDPKADVNVTASNSPDGSAPSTTRKRKGMGWLGFVFLLVLIALVVVLVWLWIRNGGIRSFPGDAAADDVDMRDELIA